MARRRKMPTGMFQKPGRPGYWCDFRAAGRRIQRKLSNDFDAASRILNQLRARADQAEYGLLDNNCSIQELKVAYLRFVEQALPRSFGRYKQSLETVLAKIGAMRILTLRRTPSCAFAQSDRTMASVPAP